MQEHKGQDQRDDHAQFVNGHNPGGFPHLQRLVIAQPGSAGGQPGKDQEQPAPLTDGLNAG